MIISGDLLILRGRKGTDAEITIQVLVIGINRGGGAECWHRLKRRGTKTLKSEHAKKKKEASATSKRQGLENTKRLSVRTGPRKLLDSKKFNYKREVTKKKKTG